jgi:hypothetical protein
METMDSWPQHIICAVGGKPKSREIVTFAIDRSGELHR